MHNSSRGPSDSAEFCVTVWADAAVTRGRDNAWSVRHKVV